MVNSATGATRDALSSADGSATIDALSLTGTYTINVSKAGFTADDVTDLTLRARRNGDGQGHAGRERRQDRSHRLRHDAGRARRRADRRAASIRRRSTRRRSSAARSTTLPLFNSAFRQGKGTGDLFVNATYFVTGGGSRRTTTFMLDGANNDEGWGRQTMLATVPIGAIQEIAVLSNAFSAEFGWTAGPALNIVTKSGTNNVHGEGALHGPARRLAGEDVLDRWLLRARTCRPA